MSPNTDLKASPYELLNRNKPKNIDWKLYLITKKKTGFLSFLRCQIIFTVSPPGIFWDEEVSHYSSALCLFLHQCCSQQFPSLPGWWSLGNSASSEQRRCGKGLLHAVPTGLSVPAEWLHWSIGGSRGAKGCPGPAEHSLLEDSQGSVSGNSVVGGIKVSRQREKEKTNLREGWQIIPSSEQYTWIMEMCSSTSRLMGSELLHYLTVINKSPNRRVSLPSRLLAYHKTNLLLSVHGAGKKTRTETNPGWRQLVCCETRALPTSWIYSSREIFW